jgi:dynein heavy chain
VLEEIDPILEPVLSKSLIKKGNNIMIKLGDKEVDYSPDFRLYLASKLFNLHYTPEVSTKVTIVNFAVKVRPCIHSLPRHRVPINSSDKGSKDEDMAT